MSWFTEMKTSSKMFAGAVAVAVAGGAAYVLYRRHAAAQTTTNPQRGPDDEDDSDSNPAEAATDVPEYKVLVLGLDGAGKSSLLAALAGQPIPPSIPVTEGFHVISMNEKTATWNLWEVGGSQSCRVHWSRFFSKANLVVYVVDSTDTDRLEQSATALNGVLSDVELSGVPLLLVFNKQDVDGAAKADQLAEAFKLTELLQTRNVQLATSQVPPPDDSGTSDVAGIVQVKQLIISLCNVDSS
ncbi:uncharacterized protein [Oscarella lobularis]|uniref:uncharacterized protein isoform X2 n=1 Tax=Oscarella lobularis TaxID=121494 RepID=UPI00331334DE